MLCRLQFIGRNSNKLIHQNGYQYQRWEIVEQVLTISPAIHLLAESHFPISTNMMILTLLRCVDSQKEYGKETLTNQT